MSRSLVSHALLLKNLFHPRFRYTIPIYQRPFSWTDKESNRLFDDIVDAMGESGQNPQFDSFFLGALVLTGNMDETAKKPLSGKLVSALNTILSGKKGLPDEIQGNFDVVDGKQRLVTLKILLCLLRDLSDNGDDPSFRQLIGDGNNGNHYRLELCGGEREFLQKHVLPPGSSLLHVPDQDNMSDSETKMNRVRDSLHQNLLDLSKEDRARLLDYVVNHCEVVIILSEEIDHAFQIFLSINETGKELTDGDILKAELMSQLAPNDVEKYRNIWEQWNDSLGEARAKAESKKKTFFNHFRFVLTSNPSNILSDFRKVVDKAGGAEPFIDNYLIPNARAYEIITSGNWPQNEKNKTEMDFVLAMLNWLPHDDWMAPAMLAITRYANEPDILLAFMRKLDRLAYGLLILPGGAPDRKKKYNPLKRSLRETTGEPDPFETVEFSPSEKKIIRAIIENSLHKNRPAAARLLLLRLDMMASGNGTAYYNELMAEEELSVEHLLPHNPAPGSRWLQDFDNGKQRARQTECLGNLFLVRHRSENPKMRNYDYDRKYAILFANGHNHPVSLTNELKQLVQWTRKDLEMRQNRLMALVDELWPV